jgi:hypothetical protein
MLFGTTSPFPSAREPRHPTSKYSAILVRERTLSLPTRSHVSRRCHHYAYRSVSHSGYPSSAFLSRLFVPCYSLSRRQQKLGPVISGTRLGEYRNVPSAGAKPIVRHRLNGFTANVDVLSGLARVCVTCGLRRRQRSGTCSSESPRRRRDATRSSIARPLVHCRCRPRHRAGW